MRVVSKKYNPHVGFSALLKFNLIGLELLIKKDGGLSLHLLIFKNFFYQSSTFFRFVPSYTPYLCAALTMAM